VFGVILMLQRYNIGQKAKSKILTIADLTLFFDRADAWPSWLYVLFMQVGHFNSSLNSILYGFTNRHFRDFPFFFLSLHFPLFAFAICRLLRLTYKNILI
jgi:hypothetical protein